MSARTTASGDSAPIRADRQQVGRHQPGRHRPHAGQRRRRRAAGARGGLPLGLRGAGRFPHPGPGRRRLGRPAGRNAHRLYSSATAGITGRRSRALYAVSGPTPVLPRFALGNWWSRLPPLHGRASTAALMERFAAEGIPFSVAVLDMDWHLTDVDPRHGSGWTGYSWNRELFPDPREFLPWLHEHGLRVTLNVHPADGVRAFEDLYPQMARALGRDPELGDPDHLRRHRSRFPRCVLRRVAPHPGAPGGGLLVDRLAVGVPFADRRHRSAVDAQPFPLHRQRAGRQAPLDLFPVRRSGQSPLPGGLFRRHGGQLGEPGLPAGVHRDRVEHRLRLVESRHRRPHVRRQG